MSLTNEVKSLKINANPSASRQNYAMCGLSQWCVDLIAQHPHAKIDSLSTAVQFVKAQLDTESETAAYVLSQSMASAHCLLDIDADVDSIVAGFLYPGLEAGWYDMATIAADLGRELVDLLVGLSQLKPLSQVMAGHTGGRSAEQFDRLRHLLLAMVDDVRIVVLKLVERGVVLASLMASAGKQNECCVQAQHARDIYAVLASRLGISALKIWLEDLAFACLEPDSFQSIQQGLADSGIAQSVCLQQFKAKLNVVISALGITDFEVFARRKSAYSIHQKMQRKQQTFSEILDVVACRVVVPDVETCYQVLSAVHSTWLPLGEAFDDYIAVPKANGYQSIHTAVYGPSDHVVEIQIRTHAMHQSAEQGVAAHWAYKERGKTVGHQEKIMLLRQLMSWQQEVGRDALIDNSVYQQLFEDRVYVFTPAGDAKDLPRGATVLDFAYQVHTEVGHRCRGGRVDGAIVPIKTVLETGMQVEILTGKQAAPRRDWLSPKSGYLNSAKSRAKVARWFKCADFDTHVAKGQRLVEQLLHKSAHSQHESVQALANRLQYQDVERFYAAVGAGDISEGRVQHGIAMLCQTASESLPSAKSVVRSQKNPKIGSTHIEAVVVQGIDNMLLQHAQCCNPKPGDALLGYITRARGVTIHQQACANVQRMQRQFPARILAAEWQAENP